MWTRQSLFSRAHRLLGERTGGEHFCHPDCQLWGQDRQWFVAWEVASQGHHLWPGVSCRGGQSCPATSTLCPGGVCWFQAEQGPHPQPGSHWQPALNLGPSWEMPVPPRSESRVRQEEAPSVSGSLGDSLGAILQAHGMGTACS